MKVDSVKDVTTQASPITYQLTLRVNILDLREPPDRVKQELYERVMSAIRGIE